MLALPSFTVLGLLVASAYAKYECNTDLGTYYPYCVNVPDGASSSDKLPTILMLSGSGARNKGDSSAVKSLSGYDGFGKVVNQYLSGNKGEDQVMAGEQFITVIPISPQYAQGGGEVRHWWPEYLDQVLDAVKSKYPVDEDRIHCSGYSMGARGCWRYATALPNVLSSTMSSAGAAERSGDGTLSQQKADATFPLLKNIVNMPVWQFAGSSDSTAGTESPKATQEQLVKLGSTVSKLSIESTDHSGMSTMPFNAQLMKWMLQQKRNGGGSSSGDDSTEEDDSVSTTKTSSKTGANTSAPTASNVPTRSATGTGSQTTGKCRGKRVKRSAHKQYVKRGLTLNAILASTGRGAVKKAIEKRQTQEKRGLTLAAINAARKAVASSNSTASASSEANGGESSDKVKKSTIILESPLERRAASAKALPFTGNAKMARRMK